MTLRLLSVFKGILLGHSIVWDQGQDLRILRDNRVSSSAGDVGRDANKWRRACVTFVSSAMTIGIVKCFSHVISFADPSVSALAKNVLCSGSVTKGMHCVQ